MVPGTQNALCNREHYKKPEPTKVQRTVSVWRSAPTDPSTTQLWDHKGRGGEMIIRARETEGCCEIVS